MLGYRVCIWSASLDAAPNLSTITVPIYPFTSSAWGWGWDLTCIFCMLKLGLCFQSVIVATSLPCLGKALLQLSVPSGQSSSWLVSPVVIWPQLCSTPSSLGAPAWCCVPQPSWPLASFPHSDPAAPLLGGLPCTPWLTLISPSVPDSDIASSRKSFLTPLLANFSYRHLWLLL